MVPNVSQFGSTEVMPETKMNYPFRTALEYQNPSSQELEVAQANVPEAASSLQG